MSDRDQSRTGGVGSLRGGPHSVRSPDLVGGPPLHQVNDRGPDRDQEPLRDTGDSPVTGYGTMSGPVGEEVLGTGEDLSDRVLVRTLPDSPSPPLRKVL